MPHYFFDLYDREALIDREGLELPGLTRARQEAIRTAAAVVRDTSPGGGSSRIVVQVRNDVGIVQATIEVDFAIRDGA